MKKQNFKVDRTELIIRLIIFADEKELLLRENGGDWIGERASGTERNRREDKFQRSDKARKVITYAHTREMRT